MVVSDRLNGALALHCVSRACIIVWSVSLSDITCPCVTPILQWFFSSVDKINVKGKNWTISVNLKNLLPWFLMTKVIIVGQYFFPIFCNVTYVILGQTLQNENYIINMKKKRSDLLNFFIVIKLYFFKPYSCDHSCQCKIIWMPCVAI